MLLVIETALAALSVALLDDDRIVAEHHEIVGRGHAETVMPAIAALVGRRGEQVTAIVVDTGPGSFTGLRVGIAAARALGLAWNVPVTGVSSLALIAAKAFADHATLDGVSVAVDAGRGQLYVQAFDRSFRGGGLAEAVAVGGLVLAPGTAVAGSGALRATGDLRRLSPEQARAADARYLPPFARALPPIPLYLRAPDAIAA